jgi:hypothetical protein
MKDQDIVEEMHLITDVKESLQDVGKWMGAITQKSEKIM